MTPQFLRLFFWHAVRPLRRHRLLAIINILSVALGIAVYLAIQIANHSANQSFAASVDLVAGKAHLEIRGSVDETWWPRLEQQSGIQAVTGIVEGAVTLPDFPGEYLRIIGLEVFSSEAFRTFALHPRNEAFSIETWLGRPNGLALTPEFAARHGLAAGDEIRVLVNSETRTLRIHSLLGAEDSPAGGQSRFAVMDIGWAQELFGTQGRLSSLQLLLDQPDRAPLIADELNALLPPDLRAEPPRQRSFQLQKMLSAFQLNLTALSMVSMLVGVFLIYNTISASVTRRRTEIGILRTLGATRIEVRCLFLGEACLLGAPGIILGAAGGVAIGQVLIGVVAETVSSLYVLLSIERSYLNPWQFAAAGAFGLAAVVTGAWVPASEAARIDPVGALSLGVHAERRELRARHWPSKALAALGLAAGLAWWSLARGPAVLAFGAAFFVLLAAALFAPGGTWLFGRFAGALLRRPVWWRLAAENLWRSVHRNAVTVAALTAAIAMMIGLTVMIFSFRRSLEAWINHGIVADLFIAPASNEILGIAAEVPPAAVDWLKARPEVESVDSFREQDVLVQGREGKPEPALLAVLRGRYRDNLQFVGAARASQVPRVFAGEGVLVTESFARRHRVRDGDEIELRTPRGLVTVRVFGTYLDYSRDQGVIMMHRDLFDRHWSEPGIHSLAVFLRGAAQPAALADAFREHFAGKGEFAIYSNRTLRDRILSIFDQAFAVTEVLRTVAIIVAIAGIFLSVTTLVTERQREIGMLRAIGASKAQVRALFMTEAAMIGVLSSALGLGAGCLLSMVLTWVVNPAFFGWTIQLQFPAAALIATPLWIVPVTLMAAAYPAHRAAGAPIAEAIREE